MIKVGVVGGTGYTGVELLRLLAQHPDVELSAITSRGEAGTAVADMFPSLRGRIGLQFTDPASSSLDDCDLVFFATPNGVAMQQAASLLAAGVRVIDLAAHFRIKDVAEWEKWYAMTHASPALVAEAVYGLPEVNRDQIRGARLVANPGCYPTATQLGLIPLIEAGCVDVATLIADVKSGVSGAGRKAETHILFAEAADNFKAYGVAGHRHLPEIRQGLGAVHGGQVGLTFVPHLTPMIRGIHATLYARITKEMDFQKLFEQRYQPEPFVDMLPPNSHPETRSVRAANVCRIALHRPQGGDTLVVLSVIDNLVKGAAGQAVQNMNLMFGFDECAGLSQIPGLALKLRRLQRRFGVAAPRVTVRAHHPWYWRASVVVLSLAFILALAVGVYDAGSRHAGYHRQAAEEELLALRAETLRQAEELERLRREVGANDGNVQMARAAQERLIQQVKDLESENGRLREDLAVFENLAKERSRTIELKGRR